VEWFAQIDGYGTTLFYLSEWQGDGGRRQRKQLPTDRSPSPVNCALQEAKAMISARSTIASKAHAVSMMVHPLRWREERIQTKAHLIGCDYQ
jgi:hypothetical protein